MFVKKMVFDTYSYINLWTVKYLNPFYAADIPNPLVRSLSSEDKTIITWFADLLFYEHQCVFCIN